MVCWSWDKYPGTSRVLWAVGYPEAAAHGRGSWAQAAQPRAAVWQDLQPFQPCSWPTNQEGDFRDTGKDFKLLSKHN